MAGAFGLVGYYFCASLRPRRILSTGVEISSADPS